MRVPALIRSGWWVAAAAVIVSLITLWAVIGPTASRAPAGDPPSDFALDRVTGADDLVVRAMVKDGVRVLLEPPTMAPAEVDRWNDEQRGKLLVPDDRVIGVAFSGVARAYPLRLMRWHEVVNDVIGGEPVAVTYSPLCDSVVVFSRSIDDEVVELGVSGYLFNSNTLLYDRRLEPAASPLWQQLDGHVVGEPKAGLTSSLPLRVATLTTWGDWRQRHPQTTVLAPQPDLKRLYKRDPYHSYFGSDLLHFPVRPLPQPGPVGLKDRLVVVTVADHHQAFALRDLAAAIGSDEGVIETEVAGLAVRISFRLVPGTAVIESLDDRRPLRAARYTFWFAWYSLGGMIPDMDEIPASEHIEEMPITPPGGA